MSTFADVRDQLIEEGRRLRRELVDSLVSGLLDGLTLGMESQDTIKHTDALTGEDSVYMRRYYLFGYRCPRKVPWPFSLFGISSIRLHKICRSDLDLEHHNHPWRWAKSLLLAGEYLESKQLTANEPLSIDGITISRGVQLERVYQAGDVNSIFADTFHKVTLPSDEHGKPRPVWSLFIAGPKMQEWGYRDPTTGLFTHWQKFAWERHPRAYS